MMLRKICSTVCVVLLLILSGCWDQHLLKDVTLVTSAGIDLLDNGKYFSSVTVRTIQEQTSGEKVNVSAPNVMEVESNTVREARDLLDRRMEYSYDGSKLKVLVLGEKLAKDDILLLLDVFYRTPRSPLSTKLVIAEGKAQDIIRLGEESHLQMGEYVSDLLLSLEDETLSPSENIQSISARLFNSGHDITLPLVTHVDHTTAKLVGLALFNDTKYTGKLENQFSMLYLLMNGQMGQSARFTKKIRDDKEIDIANYVTFDVTDVDRDLQVTANSVDDIKVKMDLKFDIDIVEFPVEDPLTVSDLQRINKELGELLTEEAKVITDKLQEANSDALGIGQRLCAFHNDLWQQMEWKDVYPNITYETNIEVRIDQQGILF